MTLESQTSRVRYIGNGSTKTFGFSFKVWKESQVRVFVGNGNTENDVSNAVSKNITSSGGSVTFSTAPKVGDVVLIKRQMPYIQEDNYINGGRFDGEEVEDRFDQDCAERQDLKGSIERAIIPPETSNKTSRQLWDDLVDSIAASQAAVGAANAAAQSAAEVASQAANEARQAVTWLKNFIADVPAGDISLNNATAWGGSSSRSLADRFSDVINVLDYGAAGDGATDDSAAIQEAFEAGIAQGKLVVFPGHRHYVIASPLVFAFSGRLSVDGMGSTIIYTSTREGSTALAFSGLIKEENINYPSAVDVDTMTLDNVFSNVQRNDLILLKNSEVIPTDFRGDDGGAAWTNGFISRVNRIAQDGIKLSSPAPVAFLAASTVTATVGSVSGKTATLPSLSDTTERIYRYKVIAGSSELYIGFWNNSTKTATFTVDVSGILSAGDTIQIKRETVASLYSPCQVEIKNLNIYRDSTVSGIWNFAGITITYGNECCLDNVKISNFFKNNLQILYSYKTKIVNSEFEGGKYIYNGGVYKSGGLGYGVRFTGGDIFLIDSCIFKSNRAGFSTACSDCRTSNAKIQNCTFIAPEGLSFNGEPLVPETSLNDRTTLTCYAFGGHGDAIRNIYKNNTIIDYGVGSSIRDEDVLFDGNVFKGQIKVALKFENFCGAVIKGNIFQPSTNTLHSRFARLQIGDRVSSCKRDWRDVVFEGNQAIGANEAFVDIAPGMPDNPDINILRNTVFRNNYIHMFSGGGVVSKGGIVVGGGDDYIGSDNVVAIDSSCKFYSNECTYDNNISDNRKKGFMGYGWRLEYNSYLQIDKNMFRVFLMKNGGKVTIPLHNNEREFKIDVTTFGNPDDENSTTGWLFPVSGAIFHWGSDANPVTKQYTMDYTSSAPDAGRIKIANISDISDSMNCIWFYLEPLSPGTFSIKNTSQTYNFYFDVMISQRD